MRGSELLDDACSRIPEVARQVVDGLDADALVWRPDPGANPIAWLLWHLARVQDDHVSELAGTEQEWATGSWASRFGLDPETMETGYGHTVQQVAAVRPDDGEVLMSYLEAVTARTREFLTTVDDEGLDRVVDASWDPPVTMGARLVSVIDDGAQHAGQASYVRGLLDRSSRAG
jgi:uncharacterized damage-inducible protein DinB